MKIKRCTKCKDDKPIAEFTKNKCNKDGLNCWCKKCQSKYIKKYYQINSEKLKKQTKKYKLNNPKKVKKTQREWDKNNIGKRKEIFKKWQKEKLKNDPIFRLNRNMSSAIRKSLKGDKNRNSWNKLIGYDNKQLKKHLKSLFQEGMTWENYGTGKNKWNIDHIIPISLFNITSTKCKAFKKCWALENLRPIWSEDNNKKSNKLFY